MHLNTGGPNRPSLVAGSHAAAGPSTGRILADMENRRPGVPASTARRRPLAWILASGCIILVCFLVALQWPARWSSPGAGMEPAGDGTVGQASSATQAPAASIDAVAPARGAMIIDDPATDETKVALQALPSAGEPMQDSGAPRAAPASGASRGSPRRAHVRKAPPGAAETDLLSTLMKFIKQDEKQEAPPGAMDALIARIEAEDSRTRHENQAALASLGGGGLPEAIIGPARSPGVQQQLRACPRANTVAGIECRRRVCARHAGEDEACPGP